MADEPTSDPSVVAELRRKGLTRYRANDGRRWEVRGECVRLGHCMVGAVIRVGPDLVQIRSLEHLEELKVSLGKERLDSEMDVPVGPGFEGCCVLEIVVL